MVYVFIVNPVSGNGKEASNFLSSLKELQSRDDRDIKIYVTKGEMDASVIAEQVAKETDGEVFIYSCGGDGTLNEVANGLYGYENASLGVVPVGSGNDFVRSIGPDKEIFLDVEAQLNGKAKPLDLFKLTMKSDDGAVSSRICVNGVNIGFDGNTAIKAHEINKATVISGSLSYIAALAYNFVLKKGADLSVTADEDNIHSGPLLLCTAANGRFCGGGFESCPNGLIDDGLIELLLVNDISRFSFLKLVPKYKNGKLFEVKGVEEITKYTQCKRVEICSNDEEMRFVADGEVMQCRSLTVEVLPQATRLVIPEK